MNKITHQTPAPNEIKVGQFYTRIDEDEGEETYILAKINDSLAKINDRFVLVCLNDGEYWSFSSNEPVNVFGTAAQKEQFKLATQPFTITPNQ